MASERVIPDPGEDFEGCLHAIADQVADELRKATAGLTPTEKARFFLMRSMQRVAEWDGHPLGVVLLQRLYLSNLAENAHHYRQALIRDRVARMWRDGGGVGEEALL